MTAAELKTVAVLDACVLYPPSLRNLLIRAAIAGGYESRWTEEIHTEWIRNVLADNSEVTPAQLDRTRCLMNQAIPSSHVLAATIEARASVIVLSALFDNNSELFLETVQRHWASLKRAPKTPADYLQTLRRTNLTGLASRVEVYLAAI